MPDCAPMVSATTQGEPGRGERIANAGEDRGQGARQNDPPDEFERGKPLDTTEFEQFRIDLPDSQRGVDVDREGDAERDQKYLFRLSDAEPDDHQRQRSQERDRADHLHAAIDGGFGDAREADQGTEHESDGAADRKAGGGAREADAEIVQQASVRRQLERGLDDLAGCREDVRRQPSSFAPAISQTMTSTTGASQESSCKPRRLNSNGTFGERRQSRIVVTMRTIECDR